jgi:hypothetical protein
VFLPELHEAGVVTTQPGLLLPTTLLFLLYRGERVDDALLLDLTGLVEHGQTVKKVLGSGSFGKVYACTLPAEPGRECCPVALKEFDAKSDVRVSHLSHWGDME